VCTFDVFCLAFDLLNQHHTSLVRLCVGGGANRLDNATLCALLTAATAHPTLLHLDFQCAAVVVDAAATRALAQLLRTNCTLRWLPIARLVYACEAKHRYDRGCEN
jgi:hypothetical protein